MAKDLLVSHFPPGTLVKTRQAMYYKVALRGVLATIVAMEKQ